MSVKPKKRSIADHSTGRPIVPRKRRDFFVIRRPIPGTDTYDVIVVSNSWRQATLAERRREATARYVLHGKGNNFSHKEIMNFYTIVGLTVDEAISLGYLPFRVEALPTRGEESLRDRLEEAIEAEGPIATAQGPQLRFGTIEDAQDAYRRLQERVPGPHWVLAVETPSE